MRSYRTLMPLLARHAPRIALGLAALLVVDLLQLLIPRVTKGAIDQISNRSATNADLALAGVAIIGLALTIGGLRYVWRMMILGFSRLVDRELRRRLYAKLLTLSPAWFLGRSTGDLMAVATNDMENIRMAAGLGLVAFCDSLLMGTASIGFMVWISPQLTLLAAAPMPLIPLLTFYLGRIMHQRSSEVQETFGRMSGIIREYLAGIRVVQAAVREDLVQRDVDRIGQEYARLNIRANRLTGSFYPLMIVLTNLSLATVLYFGGRMVILTRISTGDFVAFISYLGLLTWPMMALGWMMDLIQRGAASLDRLNLILETSPDIDDPLEPEVAPEFHGALTIRDLTFTYPGWNRPIIENLSLSCPPGRMTAIVGRTGSGKSTLLHLPGRLFDPPPGTVFLDGVDVTRMRLDDLRGAMAYVPQDGYIFSGTIAENIALANPDADEAAIRAAAGAAQLAPEIEAMPNGYGTVVGERGLTLSGGQRQRLALARALLLDPPLLLLDDTFSALDAEAEERILANLAQSRAGRTTIIVSHRLTSLKDAARIHILDGGRITESGTQAELLAAGGYFAHLHHLQRAHEDMGPPPPGEPGSVPHET